MNGAIVENLSNRKLFVILSVLVLLQIGFFLIGGLIAPQPSSAMENTMRICFDESLGSSKKWFFVRPASGCPQEMDLQWHDSPPTLKTNDTRELVFVAQLPNPRDNITLQFSPWFQTMLGLLTVETFHTKDFAMATTTPEIRMEVRLGYQTLDDPPNVWHELISTVISRKLNCKLDAQHAALEFAQYDCDPLELFELGSCDYPFYLLNIRLPGNENSSVNKDIGNVRELSVIEIHQNGGFTKVWLSMKAVLFPLMLGAVCWYWKRIMLLPRNPLLLEKALLSLGIAMLFINIPFEFLSLWVKMPFLLLLTDIRQGIFYAMLLSFWLIFCGEHLLDDNRKNQLSNYWKHLASVIFGCTCLFVFDMCERGVHLTNPFYSIWSTTLGTNLAYVFIILAAIAAILYFIFLFYWIVRVLLTIKRKRVGIAAMKPGRRVRLEAIIYRFKFLMVLTLICAALTVASFIMSQVGEGQLRWGDREESPYLNYSSSFLTGVYGMWNIYTLLLLAMYAPSHKRYAESRPIQLNAEDDDDDEDVVMATEASALTTFVTKQASD